MAQVAYTDAQRQGVDEMMKLVSRALEMSEDHSVGIWAAPHLDYALTFLIEEAKRMKQGVEAPPLIRRASEGGRTQ